MKVKTSYTDCPYVTAGKAYEFHKIGSTGHITCDDGIDRDFFLYEPSPQLGYTTWEILPDNYQSPDFEKAAAELAQALEIVLSHFRDVAGDCSDLEQADKELASLKNADDTLTKYKSTKQ